MFINTVSNVYSAQAHNSNSRIYQPNSNNATISSNTTAAGLTVSGSLDFTYMTPRQLQGTMNDLIKSGKMSLDDSSALVGMVPTALSKVNYDGQAPAAYEQPSNIIARIQDGIEGAKSRGDSANVDSLTKALGALQKLQGSVIGVDLRA